MEQLLGVTDDKRNHPKRGSLFGKLALFATGAGAIGICAVALPFISPAFRKICLPYVPATDAQIRNIVTVLQKRRTKANIVDLGSGDGRIVFEAAKLGFASAVGVELNPWLVAYSKVRSLTQKRNTQFVRSDLWKFSLRPFSNVVIFGVEEMMTDLEKKFCSELGPGSWIVACRFPVPGMKPILTEGSGIDTVWVYEVQEN